MKRLIFIILLLLPTALFGQMEKADSLVKVVETKRLDSMEKIHLYDTICDYYRKGNVDKLIEFAHKGYDLAKKQKEAAWQSAFSEYLGMGYNISGEYETALIHWNRVLDYALSIGDRNLEAFVYGCIGSNYDRRNEFITAQEYHLKALEIYEEIGNKVQCMRLFTVIGSMYRGMAMWDQAIPHLEKAESYAKEVTDTTAIMQINYELAILYIEKEEYDKALEYSRISFGLAEKTNDVINMARGLSSIAIIYSSTGRHDEALEYAVRAVKIAKSTGFPYIIADALLSLSNIHREMGNWKECEASAHESWMVDTTNVIMGFNSAYNLTMSNIHLQRTETAIGSLRKLYEVTKRYIDERAHDSVIELEYKYEAEKKEMRIAALERENKLYVLLGIAAAVVLLLIIGLLVFRHRLNVQKRRLAEEQVKQLERENQLVATQSLLDGETTERSRIARELHDGLGGMLSALKLNLGDIGSYEKMEKADIERFIASLSLIGESASELRRIVHNMMPESLVRDGLNVALTDFCRSIPVVNFRYIGNGERLGSHLELAVYRSAQELVNNALKHADASRINVQLLVNDGVVSLTVIDDGKGFDPDNVAKGAGLKNIRTRVQAFNGNVSVLSKPGSGTEIIIEIDRS